MTVAPAERPRLHVLGAGRAARVVARWLVERGRVEMGQVVNRKLESAAHAVRFIGSGHARPDFRGNLNNDWLLLGVPDRALGQVLQTRALQPALVIHLSGAHPAEAIEQPGLDAASLHPVLPFADPQRALARMDGCYWVAQGSEQALARCRAVWAVQEERWLTLGKEAKPAYHAAMICASNYLVGLTGLARQLANQAGLPEGSAAELIATLQRATLDNLDGQTAADALTGPIERGDLATLDRVCACLLPGSQSGAYGQLGLLTLELARQARGDHPNDPAIESLFQSLVKREKA